MQPIIKTLTPRLLGAAIAAAALIAPAIASAQELPSYASGPADQQIQGTVSAINGTWNITVADANGYNDSVALHQGTIINPTGLTLEPGMSVTIQGYADGSTFDANEIDTPYQYEGPPPVAEYYGPGAWYPGYAYGWGPSFSLFFDFGTRSFERRSFDYNGQVRHPEAPPSGWQNRPHGYLGNAGNSQRAGYTPPVRYAPPPQQARTSAPPSQQQMRYTAPPPQQQARTYTPPAQQRTFAPPAQQQVRYTAPPPQQQARVYAPPVQQQQRTFAPPPQQQQTRYSAPPQQQQARTFAPPPQQQTRSYSAPQRSGPAPRRPN